ncbi:MAG: protein kinase [Gemmatimonadota bacterium]|nr:protein kinase [Gemmatimonadota bacterium]
MSDCSRCGTPLPSGTRFCSHCGRQAIDPGAATLVVGTEEDALLAEVREMLAGEYDVEREIGRGAMAIVFRATEAALHRRVALKVLPPELTLNRSLADRFKREARMAAALEHPNIIPVYREGQTGRFLYIAMKLIEGRPLDDVLASQGPLPVPVVLQVLRSVASALAYAHDRGIVHRDIKGGNILIDRDGHVLVSDFGIARAAEDAGMTSTGMLIGTPWFMSPEQCAARRIGPQSDQYSLGVVGFQMLTGFVPFQAETLPGIMHHHFYTPVPNLADVRPDAPVELLRLVTRALSKKPEHRFPTTEALVATLDAIPFGENERMGGDRMLRDLALGLPVASVTAGTLPALTGTVRLTPHGPISATIEQPVPGRRTRSVLIGAATGFVLLSVVGLGAMRVSRRPLPEPPSVRPTLSSALASAPSNPARKEPTGGVAVAGPVKPSVTLPVQRLGPAVAPAPATRFGLVRIRAYPTDAQIFVDDRIRGVGVVLDASVPVGDRRLRVRAPGYQTFDTTFTVVAGETTQLSRITLSPTAEAR